MDEPLVLLALKTLQLSAMAIGGFIAVVPDMHRFIVDQQGWMTDERFIMLFAIAQAAPGPNVIVVTLLGLEIGGIAGAITITLAALLPTLIIAYGVSRFSERYARSRWYGVIERGLVPIAVGLILATGILMSATAALGSPGRMGIVAGTVLFMLLSRSSPLIPLIVAALVGVVGLA